MVINAHCCTVTHPNSSRGGRVFTSVCPFFFRMIPQKPNLTHKCSRNSPGNPPILSPKQCQHRSLHSYECWLLFFRLYDTKVLGDILLSQTLFLYSYTVLNTAKTTHTSGWRCRRIRRLCTYNTLNNYYTASQAYAATLGMGKRTVVRLRKKQ